VIDQIHQMLTPQPGRTQTSHADSKAKKKKEEKEAAANTEYGVSLQMKITISSPQL
jgi:hypothetical protein